MVFYRLPTEFVTTIKRRPTMRFPYTLAIAGLAACLALNAQAVSAAEEWVVPDDIPPPDPVEIDESLEPEVTIIQRKDATVEEYRINGRLYMVKITPFVGPSYYLLDNDGDGFMEKRIGQPYTDVVIPQWVIFSW